MRIIGHGIDIVETARIAAMVTEHGERFLDRCFTDSEQAYAAESKHRRFEHLAARFAAKEAVLKALGTGWTSGIAWSDIDILRDAEGRPGVRLGGEAAKIAATLGVEHWFLSITHSDSYAVASVIACASR